MYELPLRRKNLILYACMQPEVDQDTLTVLIVPVALAGLARSMYVRGGGLSREASGSTSLPMVSDCAPAETAIEIERTTARMWFMDHLRSALRLRRYSRR